jgi:ribonucleoside-diphosphate reductase beta chain
MVLHFLIHWFSNQKMIASGRMISYIKRDELTHVTLFANIIKTIEKENPDIYNRKCILDMMDIAVKQEIQWSNHILGNNISGITIQSIEIYTKHLANIRLSLLGIDPLYKDVIETPYKHLEHMDNFNDEKTNFLKAL